MTEPGIERKKRMGTGTKIAIGAGAAVVIGAAAGLLMAPDQDAFQSPAGRSAVTSEFEPGYYKIFNASAVTVHQEASASSPVKAQYYAGECISVIDGQTGSAFAKIDIMGGTALNPNIGYVAKSNIFPAPDCGPYHAAPQGTPADVAARLPVRDPRVTSGGGNNAATPVPETPAIEAGFYRPAVISALFWQHVNGGYKVTYVFDEGMCVHVHDGNAGPNYAAVTIRRGPDGLPMEGVMRRADLRPAPNCH